MAAADTTYGFHGALCLVLHNVLGPRLVAGLDALREGVSLLKIAQPLGLGPVVREASHVSLTPHTGDTQAESQALRDFEARAVVQVMPMQHAAGIVKRADPQHVPLPLGVRVFPASLASRALGGAVPALY